MSKVECYVVHLYCDSPDCDYMAREYLAEQTPNEFTGKNRKQAYEQARSHGWYITSTSRVTLCPFHNHPSRREAALKRARKRARKL